MPLDFYFPGKGKSGDLPPRAGFAQKWHKALLEEMPEIELFILVGSYAIKYYLNLKSSAKTTEVIHDFEAYLQKVINSLVSNFLSLFILVSSLFH